MTQAVRASPHRWRLSRAGLLNIWQYDEQVFDFADGRLLLRGTNGAGKSKTLEMLLPFVLDGDRARMDSAGRRGQTLLWLMLDGFEGTLRSGYIWLELSRVDAVGDHHFLSLAVGVRASRSARSVTTWHLVLPGRFDVELPLEDTAGPLSAPTAKEAVLAAGGDFYDAPRPYRSAVGRRLFGLDDAGYDELLRLLYWLRSPQIGESVEIAQLDQTLRLALPELDRAVVESAAENLDALQDFGEQVQRRERASAEIQTSLEVYRRYAAGEVAARVGATLGARRSTASARLAANRAAREAERAAGDELSTTRAVEQAEVADAASRVRLHELQTSETARDLAALAELGRRAAGLREAAGRSVRTADEARLRQGGAETAREIAGDEVTRRTAAVTDNLDADELRSLRLGSLPPVDVADLDQASNALTDLRRAAASASAAVDQCLAAVAVVEAAVSQQTRAEDLSAAAARTSQEARRRLDQSVEALELAEQALTGAVAAWTGISPLSLDEPPPAEAGELLTWRDRTVSPVLERVAGQEGELRRRLGELADARGSTLAKRADVAARRDPEPPPPALARTPREASEGLAFWRLVDVRPEVGRAERAGLEAALQASGLLDALVLNDGAVLRGNDVVIAATAEARSRSLADLLIPDLPADAPLRSTVVASVLRAIGLEAPADPGAAAVTGTDAVTGSDAAVGVDGSWRLGPLHGRAAKQQAQYLGATARAQERLRQLAELDDMLADLDAQTQSTTQSQSDLAQRRAAIQAWSRSLPDPSAVLNARTTTQLRSEASAEAELVAGEAEREAVARRSRTVAARSELAALCALQGFPSERPALGELAQRLSRVARDVELSARELRELRAAHLRLQHTEDDLRARTLEAARAAMEAAHQGTQAEAVTAQHDARREALSATQAQLEQALVDAESDLRAAAAARKRTETERVDAGKRVATAEAATATARERLEFAERQQRVAEIAHGELLDAPGLLAAATGSASEQASVEDLESLLTATSGMPVATGNDVLAQGQILASGSAAALAVKVTTTPSGLFTVTGTDDAGEAPLADLARRLAATVEHERTLLTSRQREVFHKHLLGELGETLRRRRLDAQRLVGHMNQLLRGVRTSQGITARLDWRLRDDAGDEVRAAIGLLDRPLGALLPEQQESLLALLSALIEQARNDQPDDGYAEHLRTALDYRTWHSFAVLIRRPGADTDERLSRRTALSQGEQKVMCYLPLFAAAAAHFTSLAGREPLAPRFILLDDAFPKIDVRTHPVLFGLLSDLELDWVITSERLWGDYPTHRAVAIYEVLRNPNERGVLPYKYLWEGGTLTAVGG